MKCRSIFNHHIVMSITNLLLTACGVSLILAGFLLYTDKNRILLSRLVASSSDKLTHLAQPFFYYIALVVAAAGIIAILASFVGWWAVCLHNYFMLSIYFLIVLTLLLIEFSACLMITLWPHCVGLDLDETTMVKALQGSYGVPGREQFTLAMDLAQTLFECCAMNSDINYDTSLWRLKGYGNLDWTVPLTCCRLDNRNEPFSYLDPKPSNMTLCQSHDKHEHTNARHGINCLELLDEWYRMHFTTFLSVNATVAIVEFAVLLSIILSCAQLGQHPVKLITTGTTMFTNVVATKKRNAPQPQIVRNENVQNETQPYIESFDDIDQIRPYNMTRSYLV